MINMIIFLGQFIFSCNVKISIEGTFTTFSNYFNQQKVLFLK